MKIVNEILKNLQKEDILTGVSVGIMNIGYKSHIPELYEHLSIMERSYLHIIYGRLDIADKYLLAFEDDILSETNESNRDKKNIMYWNRFEEMKFLYDDVLTAIEIYLNKDFPEDIPLEILKAISIKE